MKKKLLFATAAACALTPHAQAAAPPCTCKELPALVSELNEQEFLQKLFSKWAAYMPREIQTTGQLKDAATKQFNDAFYGNLGTSAAGTAHGGHAHMGTDLDSDACPIVVYHYDKKGKPELNKDGSQKTSPVTEDNYQSKQCATFVKYLFAHERKHQETCLAQVKKGKQDLWQRPDFFAADDAKAYQAGIDVLRQDTADLAAKCGWDNSTKNRLPNLEEAKELAKKAANARPGKRKKP
ncbi:MAG: hypothetical protein ABW110_00325 [Steroidobacteraceae bacterium]